MARVRQSKNLSSHGDQVASEFTGTHGDTLGDVYIAGKKRVTLWGFSTGIGWEVLVEVSPDGSRFRTSSVRLTSATPVVALPEMPCHSVQGIVSYATQPSRPVTVVVIAE